MRFSWVSWLLQKFDSKFLSYSKLLYILLNNNVTLTQFYGKNWQHNLWGLKGEFYVPSCAWAFQLSVLNFYVWKGRDCHWRTHPQGDYHLPTGCNSQQLGSVTQGHHLSLRTITAIALLVKDIKKIVVESPLAIVVHHAVEVLLYSHHIQHLSVSDLTSYELLLLMSPP